MIQVDLTYLAELLDYIARFFNEHVVCRDDVTLDIKSPYVKQEWSSELDYNLKQVCYAQC